MTTTFTSIRGNVGAEPDRITRKDSTEIAGTSFRVATPDRYRDAEGNWIDRGPHWFTVKVWGNTALNCLDSLHKGDPIIATGRLQQEEWTGTDGAQHSAMVLTANAVGMDLSQCTAFKRPSVIQAERAARDKRRAEAKNGQEGSDTATVEQREPQSTNYSLDPESEAHVSAPDTASAPF